jgi:Zn-dependent peptidase ImmA (M78 family)
VRQVQNYILDLVRKLVKKYGTTDPFDLIKHLGINLFVRNNLGELKGFYYTLSRERYIVINGNLDERDQLLVAAHELGHDRLHQHLARISPLKDFLLYDMTSMTEHEANIFASELLISDEATKECVAEDMDYLYMCRTLGFNPQLVSFKLYGMMQRGYHFNLPESINSRFLAKPNNQ